MDERFRLNPTRIFLIGLVVVALALAALTIAASLEAWREQDAAVTSGVAPPG
ncbi:hypothetical protein [Devosia sp.]|uniref:hypothetical protein n=1 Tax=Devosia sp. TaxID=1871048 RepID=UPI002F152BC0